jgi:predicted nucleic acid-binding protein
MLHFADDRQIRETMTKVISGTLESHTCETNITELYYKTCETLGIDVVEMRTAAIRNSNVEIHPVEEILTMKAGSLKCKYRGKISLADAYVLATSLELRCRLDLLRIQYLERLELYRQLFCLFFE